MKASDVRGASNTTLIIALLVIGILALIVIRIGPILWTEKSLQSSLDNMLVSEIIKMQRDEVIGSIIKAGKEAGVSLAEDQINVEYGPEENKVAIHVKYHASADLIVTTYSKDVSIVSYPIGSPVVGRVRQQVGTPATPPQTPPSYSPQPPGPPPPPPGGPYAGRAREVGKKLPGGEP